MTTFHGTAGHDDFTGGAGADIFNLGSGGSDKAAGGGGADIFHMGAALDVLDELKGNGGRDTLMLTGDYSSNLTFGATTAVGFERLYLNAGFSYHLTVNDAMVGAGETFRVNASTLGASDTLFFDGGLELDGSFKVIGGAGADEITGGAQDDHLFGKGGADQLHLSGGGSDDVYGGGGDDVIRLIDDKLDAGDHINGGKGFDRVLFYNFDYTGANAVVLAATTIMNIDQLDFYQGNDYDITSNDGNVAAGDVMVIAASALTASETLTFDGSAETDGTLSFQAGAGDDVLIGGDQGDEFSGYQGGDDTFSGGKGDDIFSMDATLTAADKIDGGESLADAVYLNGNYTGANAVVFNDTTMVAVETLYLHDGFSYDLTFADGTVNSFTNLTLTVDATALSSGFTADLDGSAEADSNYVMLGGAGGDDFVGGLFADTLNGNDGDDTLTGGGGLDDLTGGGGADTFRYTAVSESTSTSHDHVTDFDAASDFFDTTIGVTSVVTRSGNISSATFDADMGSAVDDTLPATAAAVVTATGGDLIGHTYLVVNGNGDGFYSAGVDYLIDITGFTGTITTGNFI